MKAITEIHHKAARAIAKGISTESIAADIGRHRRTLEKWKHDPDFSGLISFYQESSLIAAKSLSADEKNLELLRTIPDEERPLLGKLLVIADRLGEMLVKRLESADEEEIKEIPLRLLSPLIGAYSSCLSTLQQSNDRLSGYEFLLTEMAKIVQEVDSKSTGNKS